MTNNNTNNEIPSIITTAHLLLRGLIPAFLGCSIGDDESEKNNGGSADKCRASAFQMTFRKDLIKLGVENGKMYDVCNGCSSELMNI